MNVFFTSDPHYLHKNIAGPKVSAWKEGYRDFNNEHEMSSHIVKVWNNTVAADDVLYCLGDWAFGGINNIWNFRKQLRCQTIHLILGNHDHHIEANKILPNVIKDDGLGFINKVDGAIGRDVYAQELFASVNHVATVKHGRTTFFLSHYSHRIWLGSHKGIVHLYGHSHSSISDFGKSMDVGIDSAKKLVGEYRPFRVEEIINYMDAKQIAFVDHHNAHTNMK